MQKSSLLPSLKEALFNPETLWREKIEEDLSWSTLLKTRIVPVVAFVALVSALLTLLFGYHIPLMGVIRPTPGDAVMQLLGTVVIYTISIVALGWTAAWLAGRMGGRGVMDRGVSMLFWTSVPSLLGQMLSPIPMVGWVLGLGLGIYTVTLLYRAIPLFMELPLQQRVKHFILFLILSIVFSMLLGSTAGRLFEPRGMYEKVERAVPVAGKIAKHAREAGKSPDQYVEEYLDSMLGGDYGQKVIHESAQDTFTPPADNLLTAKQVESFVSLAEKIALVRKEQAEALKKKYDKLDKKEEPSFSDIFNGLKDLSGVATLEMKVVKSNGKNWAEYQWVKERIREAYYTPSLNEATEKNAKLIESDKESIAAVL